MKTNSPSTVEVAILGGGIAGLWTLNVLRAAGYDAVLIDESAIGCGQTLASQGMIHGGMKYNLSGLKTTASETIKAMPERWRACLAGTGTLDLSGTQVLSDVYYMFTDGRLTSQLTAFFGTMAIEGKIEAVRGGDLPSVFATPRFKGSLYRLNDLVLDTTSLISCLARPMAGHIITNSRIHNVLQKGDSIVINTDTHDLQAKFCILAAGSGNEALAEALGLPVRMQRRPLHQVVVKGQLPRLYAHAVSLASADKPMLTITTHTTQNGDTLWYLGGALAESGVSLTESQQADKARAALDKLLPWIDFGRCEFTTLRIDRAEPAQSEKNRPDTPYVNRFANTIVCWPTKLTLAPMMGDSVLSLLDPPDSRPKTVINTSREVALARSPWDDTQ